MLSHCRIFSTVEKSSAIVSKMEITTIKRKNDVTVPIYKTGKKNKNGDFQYRVTYNYTDINGKYKQKSKLVYGSAEAKAAESRLRLNNSSEETAAKLTVQRLYDEYTESKSHEVRESSLAKTKSILKFNVLPTFSSVNLDKLSIPLLQQWKNTIAAQNKKITTKQNVYKEFRAMLNYAVKVGYIASNPLLKIGNFKDPYSFDKPEEKIKYYTAEQYQSFISGLECKTPADWSYYTFFSLAFYTGMRKGEINALRWCDINGNILSVNRSVTQKLKGKGEVFTPPKNASSQRKLQIPNKLIAILDKQKEIQKKNCAKWNEEFLVCGGETCLKDTTISNKNIELATKAKLPVIRIHDFRHTHATLLINEGINIQEIARRLGHSDVNITWKVYAHLYPREEERAVNILEKV